VSPPFVVLAEREGDQFELHRIEPPASTLFYLDSHDGMPEPILSMFSDNPTSETPQPISSARTVKREKTLLMCRSPLMGGDINPMNARS
jgi:hypothetical protein